MAIALGEPFEPLFSDGTREEHLDAFRERLGKYRISAGEDLVLSIEYDRLCADYAEQTAHPRYEVHIISSDRAFMKETNSILTFRMADDGETPILTAYEGLYMWRARRYARPMRGWVGGLVRTPTTLGSTGPGAGLLSR